MATAHEVFELLRIEIFDAESLAVFGQRLGYEKSYIHRLSTGDAPLRAKHVELCRALRVPSQRRARFDELLGQLERLVSAEEQERLEQKKKAALRTQEARRARERRLTEQEWLDAWAAAVAYLQSEAAWADTLRVLLTAELVQRHVAAEAAWRVSLEVVFAAELAQRHLEAEARRRRKQLRNGVLAVAALALCLFFAQLLQTVAGRTINIYVTAQTPLNNASISTSQLSQKVRIHHLIPPKPVKGQKVTPCDAESGETAINGGCWYGGRDPGEKGCGPTEYEDTQGRCYRYVQDPNLPGRSEKETEEGRGYSRPSDDPVSP